MEIIELPLSVTNCFLIKGRNDKYILIDTGYEWDWETFRKRLKQIGVGFSDISHLILTHHHDDHCGLLNQIIEKNSGIQVVMSYLAKDLLMTGVNDRTHGGGLINKRIALLIYSTLAPLKRIKAKKWPMTFPPYAVRKNDILISVETRLSDIGIELNGRIIETPGHSIDSISIIFDDGDCIVGDAAANMLQFAGTKYCVIALGDIDEYYKSWRKIIAENAKRIFPSHGGPFSADKLIAYIGKNKKKNMVMYK
jgi:hydroxyacylglutathione hydrolase